MFKYPSSVNPAKAGIYSCTGCRIKACPLTRSGVLHNEIPLFLHTLHNGIHKALDNVSVSLAGKILDVDR